MTKPLVSVRWNDADSSCTRVLTEDRADYHAPVIVETIGWLLRSDRKGVSVVNEMYLEDGVRSYRGHTFVPRGMIITVKTLKRGKK